uniref:Cathepsin propeptide inhibitor domain-containing protein n=1 Tax=Pseudonaja textilis TaxID=8673 RepID=A0A670ZPD9_PSETE
LSSMTLFPPTRLAESHQSHSPNRDFRGRNSEAFRRTVWEKNLWRIERHNLEAARGKHSFQLAMNHLGDLVTRQTLEGVVVARRK